MIFIRHCLLFFKVNEDYLKSLTKEKDKNIGFDKSISKVSVSRLQDKANQKYCHTMNFLNNPRNLYKIFRFGLHAIQVIDAYFFIGILA